MQFNFRTGLLKDQFKAFRGIYRQKWNIIFIEYKCFLSENDLSAHVHHLDTATPLTTHAHTHSTHAEFVNFINQ